MTRAASEAEHMSAPDHGPHLSRRFLLLLKGRPHMSQTCGAYPVLSMPEAFAPPISEVAHDPERPCQAAEASVQGRLQGASLRGNADPAGCLVVPGYPL